MDPEHRGGKPGSLAHTPDYKPDPRHGHHPCEMLDTRKGMARVASRPGRISGAGRIRHERRKIGPEIKRGQLFNLEKLANARAKEKRLQEEDLAVKDVVPERVLHRQGQHRRRDKPDGLRIPELYGIANEEDLSGYKNLHRGIDQKPEEVAAEDLLSSVL